MSDPRPSRRALGWLNVGLFLLSIAAIAVSITVLLHRPRLRMQIDATKTRAYSLSRQTRALLDSLEGEWLISVVLVDAEIDRGTRRQIDEVLNRYADAAETLSVESIDPTDPAALPQYRALIDRIRRLYSDDIDAYERALDTAREAYAGAVDRAAGEAAALQQMVAQLAPDDPLRGQLEAVRNNFSLFARSGTQVTTFVDQALTTSETRPIADYEAARDALAAALGAAASDTASTAQLYGQWMTRSGLAASVQAHLARSRLELERFAGELQQAGDPLVHLEPLKISAIGEELARGEAAVVAGPDSVAVIPARQLIARSNLRATREGGITFDQRFRGEQILSSTIQSMIIDPMPAVIFVHALSGSVLEPIEGRGDYFGAANFLAAARFDVREWRITDVNPPELRDGQSAVFIIIPPTPGQDRTSIELSREEQVLVGRLRRLIAAGESILISYFPSVLHKLSQPDPWQGHLAPFGVRVDSSRVLLGSEPGEAGNRRQVQWLDTTSLTRDHPIGRAVEGQLVRLPVPLPIELVMNPPDGVERDALISAVPSSERWLEADWVDVIRARQTTPPEQTLSESTHFAVAASRWHPLDPGRRQRAIAVGSGTWLQSALADVTQNLGGDRVALVFPGNYELLLASVAWLANLDALIAQSPTAQQVARLEGVTPAVRQLWRWIALGGLPGACLILGVLVWVVRRR